MLKYWTPHAEYQHFVSDSAANLSASQRKKLSFYSDSLDKLTSLETPAPPHRMAVAFILNLTGISDYIPLLHVAQVNIRRSIITGQVQNG